MKARELRDWNGKCAYCNYYREEEKSRPILTPCRHFLYLSGMLASLALLSTGSFWVFFSLAPPQKSSSPPDTVAKVTLLAILALLALGTYTVYRALGFLLALLFFTFEFISRNVVGGAYSFYFLDEDSRLHVHICDPLTDESRWKEWRQSEGLELAVLKLRHGGWFKRPAIYGRAANFWKIVRQWDGPDDLVVEEQSGAQIGFLPIMKMLTILNTTTHIDELLKNSQQILAAEAVRDFLGQTCTRVLNLIDTMRTTVGRSKHAQEIRHQLEGALERLPVSEEQRCLLIYEWNRTSRR